jgi:hypothetical protein
MKWGSTLTGVKSEWRPLRHSVATIAATCWEAPQSAVSSCFVRLARALRRWDAVARKKLQSTPRIQISLKVPKTLLLTYKFFFTIINVRNVLYGAQLCVCVMRDKHVMQERCYLL